MSDHLSRVLIDHLIDRQVCSPPQNACRNDHRIEEAIAALTASEAREAEKDARIRELEEALKDARDDFNNAIGALDGEGIGDVPGYLVTLARIDAALSQEKK